MCDDHFQPEQFSQRHSNGRSDGLDMNHVSADASGVKDGFDGMDSGLETTCSRSAQILKLHPFKFGTHRIFMDEAFAAHHGNVATQGGKTREEFLAMRLYAPLNIGKASVTTIFIFLIL